ncbi:MAG: tol-pal system protein YbgF [Methylosarcina sp.]
MKSHSLLLLFALGGFSMPSCALPPVVNTTGNPAPAPGKTNAPRPPSSNTMYEILNRLEQLQSEVQTLTGKVEEQAYQNTELKKRLSTMYSDFDERVQNVENKLDGEKPADVENAAESESSATDQPAQENSAAPGEAPDAEPKPAESQDQVSDKAPAPAAAPQEAKSEPIPDAENQEYRQAYDALRNGRTMQSIEAFNAFLNKYPSSQLAGNAQYWLGEAYRVNQDADSARKAFNKVIDTYPGSAKVPDALLKLGYVEFDLNNMAKAREHLTQVTTNFPNTTAARLASKKLLLIKDANP